MALNSVHITTSPVDSESVLHAMDLALLFDLHRETNNQQLRCA
jgi:hypothetical protein